MSYSLRINKTLTLPVIFVENKTKKWTHVMGFVDKKIDKLETIEFLFAGRDHYSIELKDYVNICRSDQRVNYITRLGHSYNILFHYDEEKNLWIDSVELIVYGRFDKSVPGEDEKGWEMAKKAKRLEKQFKRLEWRSTALREMDITKPETWEWLEEANPTSPATPETPEKQNIDWEKSKNPRKNPYKHSHSRRASCPTFG